MLISYAINFFVINSSQRKYSKEIVYLTGIY